MKITCIKNLIELLQETQENLPVVVKFKQGLFYLSREYEIHNDDSRFLAIKWYLGVSRKLNTGILKDIIKDAYIHNYDSMFTDYNIFPEYKVCVGFVINDYYKSKMNSFKTVNEAYITESEGEKCLVFEIEE